MFEAIFMLLLYGWSIGLILISSDVVIAGTGLLGTHWLVVRLFIYCLKRPIKSAEPLNLDAGTDRLMIEHLSNYLSDRTD